MFLLVDNYDSFTYNLYALFFKCGVNLKIVKNSEFLPAAEYEGIILSPGPSNPANSGNTLRYIEDYMGQIPIFGVCLGMQCVGYKLNFKIKRAESVMHGKVDKINILNRKILFKNLNDFQAVRYHSLAVDINKDNDLVTALSESDNETMAIEDIDRKFFGVQFHPESFLSDYGLNIARNFIKFVRGGV
jgi:anthranilate synthase component 2